MDNLVQEQRRTRAITALLPLFFVSGATALIYQTLWVRELQLIFGTSTFAIATVLAAFMLGLAIGGYFIGKIADSVARPLAVYGALEIGIGLYALVFPVLVTIITPIYLEVWRALEPGPVAFGGIQFLLVGTSLLLPTAAMGGTLPLLARFATDRIGAAGDRIGTLYAVNTTGAVFGTWFAGFILLPTFGRFNATLAAAAANLILGLLAIALDRWSASAQEALNNTARKATTRPAAMTPVMIGIALAGFASLVYEIAWTRLLGLMLGGSVYTFSVMLLAFLIGIAAGGKLGGPLSDSLYKKGGVKAVLTAFAAIEAGIAVLSYILMYAYPELPFWYVWLFDALSAADKPQFMWVVSLVLSGAIMTPPAVLMGMHFPMAVRAVVGEEEGLGGPVGMLYGANTLAGAFGAFIAGFILLPGAYVQGTVFVAAMANLLAATYLLYWAHKDSGKATLYAGGVGATMLVGILAFVAQKPPWDPLVMTAGTYHYVSHFEDHSREGIIEYAVEQYTLRFYQEGLSSVVTVAENEETGNIWLANNGKVDASTTSDMPTQVLCSLLPMQYRQDLDEVLVIGLASGITAGAVAGIPDVGRLDIVELEPAIETAARIFEEHNHYVLDDPRVNLITNDGRNHILLTEPGAYDVIVSEPSNPWISGVSNLFTREFFELGKTRLKKDGVWSQWVQMYGMDITDLKTLLRTFTEVYDHVLVYATIEESDLVLIGSDAPLIPSKAAATRLLSWPKAKSELALAEIHTVQDLLAVYSMNKPTVLEIVGDAELNTDDNMRIEYSAPLHLHVDTQDLNMSLIRDNLQFPVESLGEDPHRWAVIARAYHERSDPRAVKAMAEAIKRLEPSDARRSVWLDEANTWQRELEEALEEEE